MAHEPCSIAARPFSSRPSTPGPRPGEPERGPEGLPLEMDKIIKAAALVEYNGRDYATYLCNVFNDDPEFQQVARVKDALT